MDHSNGSSSRIKETLVDAVKTKKRRSTRENSILSSSKNESVSTASSRSSRRGKKRRTAQKPPVRPPPLSITDEGQQVFEVEKVISMSGDIVDEVRFRVRWKGYTEADDTWEPLSNVDGCLKLVRSFLVKRRSHTKQLMDPLKRETEMSLVSEMMAKVDDMIKSQGNDTSTLSSSSSSSSSSTTSSLSSAISSPSFSTVDPTQSSDSADAQESHSSLSTTLVVPHALPPPLSALPSDSLLCDRAISINSSDSADSISSSSTLRPLSTMSRQSPPQTRSDVHNSPRPLPTDNHSPSPSRQVNGQHKSSGDKNGVQVENVIVHEVVSPVADIEFDPNLEPAVEAESCPVPNETPDQRFERELEAFRNIFRDLSWPQITVETPPRDAIFQTNFRFIDQSIFHPDTESLEHGDDFLMRCQCGPGGCKIRPDGSTSCYCLSEAIRVGAVDQPGVPFDNDGRISVDLKSTAVWMCNKLCPCGPECVTKASTLGRQAKLRLKWTGVKGWGMFLDQDEPIPPRTFISRYVGEIVTTDEAEKRGHEYDRQGATYLFDMDCNNDDVARYTIDAKRVGNESHFFNHSCRPNLQVYNLFGEYADVNVMAPSFWTIRTIRKGDELTFDYNGHYKASWLRASGEKDSDDEDDDENIKADDALESSRQTTKFGLRQPQQQQQQGKSKRRRQVDSEDDLDDPEVSSSGGEEGTRRRLLHGGQPLANDVASRVTGNSLDSSSQHAPSTPPPTVQLPSASSPAAKSKRPPVDRSRAARKRGSGGYSWSKVPFASASTLAPPAQSTYTTTSSSSATATNSALSQDWQRSNSVSDITKISCACGEKNCRRWVHISKMGD